MPPAASAPNRAHAFATALFEELARAGLRHTCVCPGSRSTPLVAAASQQPGLRCFAHVDERSAGFFALGLARTSRAPVAVVCTSGTAAANLHPAVIEAHYARVPLILLTADRPPELRGWGAGQTIDQVRLYGPHVRWFAEAPVPEAGGALLRHARALAARAFACAAGRPPGPVHLNLPFRDPLHPEPVPGDVPPDLAERDPLAAAGRPGRPYASVSRSASPPAPRDTARLTELALARPRGVIACGPIDAGPDLAGAVAGLGRAAGWPVLADPASQLRCGVHTEGAPVIGGSDLLLRDERFAAGHAPDLVLRIGATPTSASLRRWLERRPPEDLVLVDEHGGYADPSQLASELLCADPIALCDTLARRVAARAPERAESAWLRDFVEADRRAARAVAGALGGEDALLPPRAVRELAALLPERALLYVSNSMPVRDLDAFLPVSSRALRVLCNRGANGIDGMISSALGAAAAGAAPVVLLTGDLAFLHDLGGLAAAARHGLRAAIVLLHNDGGGIFSFLPVAAHREAVSFDALFTAPHGLDFAPAARTFGAAHTRVSSWEHFRTSLKEALADPGVFIVEVPVDRERDVAHHRAIERAVRAALADPGSEAGGARRGPAAPKAPGAPPAGAETGATDGSGPAPREPADPGGER